MKSASWVVYLILLSPLFCWASGDDVSNVVRLFSKPETGAPLSTECAELLVERLRMSAQDGEPIFDGGGKEVYDWERSQIEPVRATNPDRAYFSELIRQVHEEGRSRKELIPRIGLSDTGYAYGVFKQSDGLLKVTSINSYQQSDQFGVAARSIIIENPFGSEKVHVGNVSKDGRYVELHTDERTAVSVMDLASKKIVFQKFAQSDLEGASVHFGENNIITFLSGQYLSAHRILDEEVTQISALVVADSSHLMTEEIAIPFVLNFISHAYYLEASNSFLAFYAGAPPALLKLTGNGTYRVEVFDGSFFRGQSDVDGAPETNSDAKTIGETIADSIKRQLEEFPYKMGGYLSEDQDLMVAVRTTGSGDTYRAFVEIYSLGERKLIRTLETDLNLRGVPSRILVSPNKRFLALSVTSVGVKIFDLESPRTTGWLDIDFEIAEASLVAFESDCFLVTGSRNYASLTRFEIPFCQ